MDAVNMWGKKIIAGISLFLLMLLPISPAIYAEESTNPTDPIVLPADNTSSSPDVPPVTTTAPQIAPTSEPVENTLTPTMTDPPKEVSVPEKDTGLEVTPIESEPTETLDTINQDNKDNSCNEDCDDDQKDETNKESTDVDNDNSGNVTNDVDASGNSGDNMANENDGDVLLNTGDVNIVLSIMNLINSQLIGLSPDGIKFVVKNLNGYDQDIVIDPKTGNITSLNGGPVLLGNINNLNNADLTNDINLTGNTGSNEANENDGNVSINTGNLNFSVNLLNFLNSTFAVGDFGSIGIMNIFGNLNGNIVVPELEDGGDTNTDVLEKIRSLINNDNNAEVINTINENANTGGNLANSNDGDVGIDTGKVSDFLNLSNFANINLIGDTVYMAIINVLGKFNGQKLLSPLIAFFTDGQLAFSNNPDNTDQNSDSRNEIDNNNSSLLTNFINLFANTGNNSANENDGNTQIKTGDISIITNVLNFSNFNIIANKFVFLIVNVFGDWNGKIAFVKDKNNVSNLPTQETKVPEPTQEIKNVVTPLMGKSSLVLAATNNAQGDLAWESSAPQYTPFENPFNLEKPESNVLTAFVLDNLNQIIFYGFLAYLLAIVVYFAIRMSKFDR